MDQTYLDHGRVVVVFRHRFLAEARGNCFKGSSCKFAHGLSALRSKPDSETVSVSTRSLLGFSEEMMFFLRDTEKPENDEANVYLKRKMIGRLK